MMKSLVIFVTTILLTQCRAANPVEKPQASKPMTQKSAQIAQPKVTKLPEILSKQEGGIQGGRYLGYYKNTARNVSHPLVIDLVPYGFTKSRVKLRGVVKILNDHYASHEYQSQYFLHIDYLRNEDKLVFKNTNTVVQLMDVGVHGEVIQGQMILDKDGTPGTFISKWQPPGDTNTNYQTLLTEFPVEDNLTGFYRTKCEDKTEFISIANSPAFEKSDNLAKSWKVTGTRHLLQSPSCVTNCRKVDYDKGSFNSANGHLVLKNNDETLTCTKEVNALQCDNSCTYTKTKNSIPSKYVVHKKKFGALKFAKIDKPEATELTGVYYGFLHHETRDQFQLMRLMVDYSDAMQEKYGKWDYLSGHATLFFGKSDSKEFIVHKFAKRRFVAKRKVFVFDGPGESFLAATDWGKENMRGIWYSKTFGRVGTVELLKGRIPPIARAARIIPKLQGSYASDSKSIQIATRSMPTKNNWDIYPLNLLGLKETVGGRKAVILSGKYDLFSGTLRLDIEEASDSISYFKNHGRTLVFPTYEPASDEVIAGEFKKSAETAAKVAEMKLKNPKKFSK